jgi:5-enolpyruvylshikimate-3-phosphate synthase
VYLCPCYIDHIRSPGKAFVEGDASSASYFLAGAAITGGTVTVQGCGTTSLQVSPFNFLSPHLFDIVVKMPLMFFLNIVGGCEIC